MSNDERRFEELWDRYRERLIGLAIALGRDKEDAYDIVQEVLLATWRRLDFVDREKEWAYLATAVRNRAIRHHHQNDRDEVSLDLVAERPAGIQSAETELILREQLGEVQRSFAAVFSRFSAETQLVFILDQRGWSSKTIASHLGMRDTAVRSRLLRANQQLDQQFGPEKKR